jgi:small subunit ribosomal protein S3e
MYFLGVLGIKIKIMLPWDRKGKLGPKKPLPDNVIVVEPEEDILPIAPTSDVKSKPEVAVPAVPIEPVVG